MAKKNKKDKIISAFQKMDTNLLHELLDDSRTYQGVSKLTFIDKINEVFKDSRLEGNEFFNAHKGYCLNKDCPNIGCTGYSFIGNNSREYIDLIFEESDLDFTDIHNCQEFETYEAVNFIDNIVDIGPKISIHFCIDERVGFKPTSDFLAQDQKFINALNELSVYKNSLLNANIFSEWLQKHKPLFEEFESPPSEYKNQVKFYDLFNSLNSLLKFSNYEGLAKKAVEDFNKIDIEDELNLLKWLCKYEELGINLWWLPLDSCTDFKQIQDYFIPTSHLTAIVTVNEIFQEYYYDLLDKYYRFETRVISNDYSLTYQLRRIGLL